MGWNYFNAFYLFEKKIVLEMMLLKEVMEDDTRNRIFIPREEIVRYD